MSFKLTYDQIEGVYDSFDSYTDLIMFAINQLNGNYHMDMGIQMLMVELYNNGYYVE